MDFSFDDSLFEDHCDETRKENGKENQKSWSVKHCDSMWFNSATVATSMDAQERMQVLKYQADVLYHQKQFHMSCDAYHSLLEMLPSNNVVMRKEVQENIIRCLLAKGEPEKALQAMSKLNFGNSPEHRTNRLLLFKEAYSRMKNIKDLLLTLQHLVNLHLINFYYWLELANAYIMDYSSSHQAITDQVCHLNLRCCPGETCKLQNFDLSCAHSIGTNVKTCLNTSEDTQALNLENMNSKCDQSTSEEFTLQNGIQNCIGTSCHTEITCTSPKRKNALKDQTLFGNYCASSVLSVHLIDRFNYFRNVCTVLGPEHKIVIATCLLRARLCSKFSFHQTASFGRLRVFEMQKQMEHTLDQLKLTSDQEERATKFLTQDLVHEKNRELLSEKYRINPDDKDFQKNFEQKWFSWT